MGARRVNMDNRMKSLEANVAIMKGYLCDLKETVVGREGDRGKTPVGHELLLLYSPPERETMVPPPTRNEKDLGGGRSNYL